MLLGRYEASSTGLIRHAKRKQIRRTGKRNGYFAVTIAACVGQPRRLIGVHRLVTNAFLGPCPIGHEVNHKNCIKTDNSIENLEYVTPSENAKHGYRVLNRIPPIGRGEKNYFAKLSSSDVLAIRSMLASGKQPDDIAAEFSVHYNTIIRIRAGRTWRSL